MGRTDKSNNNAKASSAPRRRAGTSIDDFAHRKGVTKAIQDFRKRKEKKRTETAKALRQYKKTMKQEGYEPGRGASRKRVEKEKQDHDNNNKNNNNKNNNNGNKKVPKSNPFAKSLQKSEERKKQKNQAAAEKEAQEKEREKKIKERRIRSKKLRQRTSKGQPIMKHVIHDILRKLEREKEDEKEE